MNILFVDDESSLLEGFRGILRRKRDVWNSFFATDGSAALRLLETEDIDVIVSDMRMPGMDGLELLTLVKSRFPQVSRMVLTGEAQPDAIARVSAITQSQLAKPCGSELLIESLEKTERLRERLGRFHAKDRLGLCADLPCPPATHRAISAALEEEDASASSIAQIIERDYAMASRLVRVSNSPIFGVGKPIESVEKSIMYLGLDFVRSFVAAVGIFFPDPDSTQFANLFAHSMSVAHKMAATAPDKMTQGDWWTCGLLHDLGRATLLNLVGAPYAQIVKRTRDSETDLVQLETQSYGLNHADLGALLIQSWNLPMGSVRAIETHHSPEGVMEADCTLTTALFIMEASTLQPERKPAELGLDPTLPSLRTVLELMENSQGVAA